MGAPRPIRREEIDGLDALRLSDPFDPFLAHFTRETLRLGGEAIVASGEAAVEGLLLTDPTGPWGSVFARTEATAARLRAARPDRSVFSEFRFGRTGEAFDLFRIRLGPEAASPKLRHRLRIAGPADEPALLAIGQAAFELSGVPGGLFRPSMEEQAIVAEIDGAVVGEGWVHVAGRAARLHGLAVSPPYRGLGLGGDLVRARLAWAHGRGAEWAVSEVAASNAPSRAASISAGLSPEGTIYLVGPG